MPLKFDPRQSPAVRKLLSPFSSSPHAPLVHEADLRETRIVLDALPKLEFPINSAGELVDKLGSGGKPLNIVGVQVDPAGMIHHFPAHYFPIASLENFAEKIAELIRNNRKPVDVIKELKSIKTQLPKMRFPIADVAALVKQLSAKKSYKYQGSEIVPEEIADRIDPGIFPINSQEDFDRKIGYLMVNQPLIVGHRKGAGG